MLVDVFVTAWLLYVVGLALAIGAATGTLVTGWAALGGLVLGLAVFAVGIALEKRRA